ncbi:hypothetical protein ACVMHR_010120 [Bradyrhizobium diazoefficiens]
MIPIAQKGFGMPKSITSVQKTFSKIDLRLIQKIEKKLATNIEEALAWARDPDGYMFANLKDRRDRKVFTSIFAWVAIYFLRTRSFRRTR